MLKIYKSKRKETKIIESKPEQLANIVYAAIVRYIKAENARNRDKNMNFALDVERKNSYIVEGNN